MRIDFNRVDDLNARMTIVVEQSDYAPKLDENLRKYSKKLNLKGFRSGKTPKSVLAKMYGKGMLEETVHEILNESVSAYLEQEKLDIFGSPLVTTVEPVEFSPKHPSDYTFNFDLGIKPDFELRYHFEEPVEALHVNPDEDAIDREILHFRHLFGKEIQSEGPVGEKDKVIVNILPKDEDPSPGQPQNYTIDLFRTSGSAKTELPGKNIGDILDVDLEEFLGAGREFIVKHVLNLEEDPGEPLQFKLEIKEIFQKSSEELTGEQISKFAGIKVEDETELRQMLRARFVEQNLSRQEDLKKMIVRRTLLQMNPFGIPEDFLLKWINQQREKVIETGSREAAKFFRDAKWSLLLNRIAKDAGLEVTEKDIEKRVKEWIVRNVDYTKTDLRKLLKELYANEYFIKSIEENALEDKVFEHIFTQLAFTEKTVSKEEFDQSFHDLHHELFNHEHHSHDEYH